MRKLAFLGAGLLAGCVQRAPLATVEGHCGHLREIAPAQYRQCAQNVAIGNQMRQDSWNNSSQTYSSPPAAYSLPPVPTYTPAPRTPMYQPAATPEAPPRQVESTPPQRWIDTPYAPMIPPVYRTEPVGTGGAAIPPVAR